MENHTHFKTRKMSQEPNMQVLEKTLELLWHNDKVGKPQPFL